MTPAASSPMPTTRVLVLAADPASTITEIRLTSPLAPLAAAGRVARGSDGG